MSLENIQQKINFSLNVNIHHNNFIVTFILAISSNIASHTMTSIAVGCQITVAK